MSISKPEEVADYTLDTIREQTANEPMLQWFDYGHLQGSLRSVSLNFASLALCVVLTLPRNAERTVCLRKLLEAKDCAVRASISK